jgi:hypothetical protein
MEPLKHLSPSELLKLHAQVSEELRARGVVRSSNNPTGDLAEYLFCRAFGWKQASNSHPNADATGPDGTTLYQIKGRRWTPHNKSRQLGALRGLPDGGFHFWRRCCSRLTIPWTARQSSRTQRSTRTRSLSAIPTVGSSCCAMPSGRGLMCKTSQVSFAGQHFDGNERMRERLTC